jgi:hypothetical protein
MGVFKPCAKHETLLYEALATCEHRSAEGCA